MRCLFGFVFVLALGVMGCSEAEGPPPECQTACDCDDDNACTRDSCLFGGCDHGTRACIDDNDCTHDECDPDTGCNYPAKSNDAYCAGYEQCGLCNGVWCCIQHYEGDCRNGECYALESDELYVPSCASFIDCDDGNDCTEDLCPNGKCENRQVGDGTRCDADLYDEWTGSGTCQVGVCVAPCDPASREESPCPTEGFENFLCCPCTENCQFNC
jgi:hypothetical protein